MEPGTLQGPREIAGPLDIRYNANGLVNVVAQDWRDGRILMVAWANAEAIALTVNTGFAHYFSRSRNVLWKKGETSGHVQSVAEIWLDCDGDAVIYRVRQTGAACHTGQPDCFFRMIPMLGQTSGPRSP